MTEAIIVHAEALAMFYSERRCADLDAVVDVRTRFAIGVIGRADARR